MTQKKKKAELATATTEVCDTTTTTAKEKTKGVYIYSALCSAEDVKEQNSSFTQSIGFKKVIDGNATENGLNQYQSLDGIVKAVHGMGLVETAQKFQQQQNLFERLEKNGYVWKSGEPDKNGNLRYNWINPKTATPSKIKAVKAELEAEKAQKAELVKLLEKSGIAIPKELA